MTIKISQLGNLVSFTGSTIFPVVDTSNAYITVKSTGSTLLNYIAGNLTALTVGGNVTTTSYFLGNGSQLTGMNQYSNVQVATYLPSYTGYIGGTLSTATQANVTTLGTLTAVVTTGNITCNGVVFSTGISTNLFNEAVNFVNVAASSTYSLSSTKTNNLLVIFASNPTATINMPTSPVDGQVTKISANANVVLAVGTGTVSPPFAGANILISPLKYVYSSQYSTWFKG